MDFDGVTYDPALDRARLTTQLQRVREAMLDGKPHTLSSLAVRLNYPEASISARIRDLRKPKNGAHQIKRTRNPLVPGLHSYQLVRS